MKQKIRLTKLKEERKSRYEFLGEKQIIEGFIHDNTLFSKVPTTGKPFVLDTYRTSIVMEILSDNTFKTLNSTYKWEKIN